MYFIIFILFRCIPCPAGHYINSELMTCEPCPQGTVIYSGLSWGVDSCVKCGPGLVPFNGQRCISHCTYRSADQEGLHLHRVGEVSVIAMKYFIVTWV